VSVLAAAALVVAALLLRTGGERPAPGPSSIPDRNPPSCPPLRAVRRRQPFAAAGTPAAVSAPDAIATPSAGDPAAGLANAASAGAADAGQSVPGALPPGPADVAAAAGQASFVGVVASVTVAPLGFDPTAPGARELRAADRQVRQNRLSTPAGDNAVDSLLSAQQAGAATPLLDAAAAKLFTAFATTLSANFRKGDMKSAEATYKRALAYATKSNRLGSAAWLKLRAALPPLLTARLNKVIDAGDAAGLALAKALARTMDLDPKMLEPAWSREIAVQKPGRPAAGPGPTVVMVIPASAGRPGVAFMREEVSRGDYASFASKTGRPVAKCRNRLAPINLKKRSWSAPGFEQSGAHPAVCVSYEDARAYAAWLSERTGETFRLPTAAEFKRVASYSGSGNACQDGRVSCGGDGTVPAGQGPASPLGLLGVKGNAREWLADCAGNCKQHLVGGVGWRDSANRAQPNRTDGMNADVGFDDVGFRLVREVPAR
jgi:hypothetical protein